MKLLTMMSLLFSLVGIKPQHNLEGKEFKALIGQSCKDMTNGGCMIYTYRILKFKTDSVVVAYQLLAYCSPSEAAHNYTYVHDQSTPNHKWSACNDTITIEGLDDYGTLIWQESKMIGTDKFTERHIEFNEVKE